MELNKIITQIREIKKWKNESKIIGEACEEYIIKNIKCIKCNFINYEKCKINEKSKDIICNNCCQNYQIKAKCVTQNQINNILSKKIFKTVGGEYTTTIHNINQNIDYIIILYEKKSYNIKNILYIQSESINTECIIPRNPLSATARRAGWQGCNIIFKNFKIII